MGESPSSGDLGVPPGSLSCRAGLIGSPRFLPSSRQIPEYCRALEENEISEHCFDLIFAFDEIVALGYRENVNLAQIRTFTEMDSHEEKVFRAVREVGKGCGFFRATHAPLRHGGRGFWCLVTYVPKHLPGFLRRRKSARPRLKCAGRPRSCNRHAGTLSAGAPKHQALVVLAALPCQEAPQPP